MPDCATYAEVKDSGARWLGAIPKSWKTRSLKYLFTIKKTIAGKLGHTVLSVTQSGIKPKKMSEKGQFSLDYSKYQIVQVGDYVMNHMDLLTGWVDVSNYDGVTSPDYRVFVNSNPSRFISDYYNYIFQSCYSNKIFYGLGKGVSGFGRWRLPADMFLNFTLPVPPLEEQKAIADFLNDQCPQIDAIIAASKASIEDYKLLKQSVITRAVTKGLDLNAEMKDSGVDWIGGIPKKWQLSKIKYVADFNPKLEVVFDPSLPIGYTPMECIKNGYMIPKRTAYATLSTGLTSFQSGDIVMAKVTPCFENGNIAIADGLAQDVAFGSSELFSFRNQAILNEFLFFYLQSEGFKSKCIATMTGTGGLKRVSGYFVKNANILVPPVETQKEIATYITTQCEAIEALVSEKQSLISDLVAYKRSLIYEAVTGKRKVV